MKYTNVHSYGGCLHNKDMESRQMKNGRRSHGDKIIEKVHWVDFPHRKRLELSLNINFCWHLKTITK